MDSNVRYRILGVVCGALVVPAALGCGSQTPTPPGEKPPVGGEDGGMASTFKSGSRLRARVEEGKGGAVRFIGWQDTKLDQACSFRPADDGKIRCLPTSDQGASMAYLDAACTEPTGVRTCGSTARYILVQAGPAACEPADTPYSVYEMGDKAAAASTFSLAQGICLPDDPASPGKELHQVTKVPASTFVEATLVEDAHGPRIVADVLHGEDGSRQILRMHDSDLHVECEAQMDALGKLRCAPALSALSSGTFFEDSACSVPLLADISANPDCPGPRFAQDFSAPPVCDKGWSAVAVGKKLATTSIYQGAPGACDLAAFLPPNWAFYEIGAKVDPSTLAELSVKEEGKGRLQLLYYAAEDGKMLAQGRAFRDSESGSTCIARPFSDGKTRCVPESVQRFNLYSDAACTVPLAAVPQDPSCPSAAPTMGMMSAPPADPLCPGAMVVDQIHAIGAKWTGAMVYSKSTSNGCAGLDPALLHADIYEVGDALDASMLAPVTEKTE